MINLRLLQKRFPKPEAPRPKPKKTTVKKSNNDQSQQPILSDDEFTIIEDEDRFDKYMK